MKHFPNRSAKHARLTTDLNGKPPDKKPGISDRSSFLRRRSVKFQFVWQKLCYNIPPAGLFQKHVGLRDLSAKYQKSFVCLLEMYLMVWKRAFYRNDDLSTTCQCRQLKLNRLSTQINTYCLWPIKRLRCRYNAVRERELQWCYYSPSIYLVPLPLQLWSSTPAPLVHLKIKVASINRWCKLLRGCDFLKTGKRW